MGKRGNHEGSIYEQPRRRILKDGTVVETKRYAGAVSLEAGNRKVFYGKTRADVAKKLSAALEQHDKGVPFTPDKLTVAKYLADWLEQSAKPKLKPSTYQTYKHYLEAHIIPALGKHPITKLGPGHVQAFSMPRSQAASPRGQWSNCTRSSEAHSIAPSSGSWWLATSRPWSTFHGCRAPACSR